MAHDSVEYTESVQEVRRVIDDWRKAVNAGDIDRILQITADDFEIMPQVSQHCRGRIEEIIMCGGWAIQPTNTHRP